MHDSMTQESSNSAGKPVLDGEKVIMEPRTSDDIEKASGNRTATAGLGEDEQEYPPMRKVIFIITSLYLAMFLVSLVS